MVSSAILLAWDGCQPSQPVPVMLFHGTADPLTAYAGGYSGLFKVVFPGIEPWVGELASRNGCAPEPSRAVVSREVTRATFADCTAGADVVFYTVLGGGHTWAGSSPAPFVGHTTTDIDATRTLWEFFRQHPRVRRATGRS